MDFVDQIYRQGMTPLIHSIQLPYKKTIEEIDAELINYTEGGVYGRHTHAHIFTEYRDLHE